MDFEYDDGNLSHLRSDPIRGLDPVIIEQVASNEEHEPKLFAASEQGHSGTHRMIGRDASGRFWTVILLDRGNDRWRPITGWPSTRKQIRLYLQEEAGDGEKA